MESLSFKGNQVANQPMLATWEACLTSWDSKLIPGSSTRGWG